MSQASQNGSPNRLPKFVQGRRQMSIAALRERIEAQFLQEVGPDLLLQTADESARRALIGDVIDYILAVETATLSRPERHALINELYADLFELGPLNHFVHDETVTELTIDGPERVHVRHAAGDMQLTDRQFEDGDHLVRIIQRLLSTAGVQFSEDTPFVEVGVTLLKRPARLTVAAPPISPVLHVGVRLHPTQPLTLAELVTRDFLTQTAAETLRDALHAGRGVMLVGDVGTGKTTLLEALLPELPAHSAIVERSAELRVPPDMERFAGVDFSLAIETALGKAPPWLVLDEVRFDEARVMWTALDGEQRPRCLWAFRGATDVNRLRAAFSMSVRRAQPTIEQSVIVGALVERLPLVAILVRRESALKMVTLGEWVRDDTAGVALRSLPI